MTKVDSTTPESQHGTDVSRSPWESIHSRDDGPAVALAYAYVFWPELIEVDGFVLIKENYDSEYLARVGGGVRPGECRGDHQHDLPGRSLPRRGYGVGSRRLDEVGRDGSRRVEGTRAIAIPREGVRRDVRLVFRRWRPRRVAVPGDAISARANDRPLSPVPATDLPAPTATRRAGTRPTTRRTTRRAGQRATSRDRPRH